MTHTTVMVTSISVCPKCGTIKKSGKTSCCGRGGSWFGNCGNIGERTIGHTWFEGSHVCQSRAPTPISPVHQAAIAFTENTTPTVNLTTPTVNLTTPTVNGMSMSAHVMEGHDFAEMSMIDLAHEPLASRGRERVLGIIVRISLSLSFAFLTGIESLVC